MIRLCGKVHWGQGEELHLTLPLTGCPPTCVPASTFLRHGGPFPPSGLSWELNSVTPGKAAATKRPPNQWWVFFRSIAHFTHCSPSCSNIHTHTHISQVLLWEVLLTFPMEKNKRNHFQEEKLNSTQDEDCKGHLYSQGRRIGDWKQQRDTYSPVLPCPGRNRSRGHQSTQIWLGICWVKGRA